MGCNVSVQNITHLSCRNCHSVGILGFLRLFGSGFKFYNGVPEKHLWYEERSVWLTDDITNSTHMGWTRLWSRWTRMLRGSDIDQPPHRKHRILSHLTFCLWFWCPPIRFQTTEPDPLFEYLFFPVFVGFVLSYSLSFPCYRDPSRRRMLIWRWFDAITQLVN